MCTSLPRRPNTGLHLKIGENVAEQHGQIIGFGEAAPGNIIAVYVDPTHIVAASAA